MGKVAAVVDLMELMFLVVETFPVHPVMVPVGAMEQEELF
jgi:hypothetical protein